MRKRLWIDVPLQLRVLVFVLMLLSATLALSYLSVSRALEKEALENILSPFLIASAIALIGGALIAFVWAHRLVGPLMVLTAALRRIGQGDLRSGLVLRKTDLQWDTTLEFERLRQSLREQIHKDRVRLSKVANRMEALSARVRSKQAAEEILSLREELDKVTSSFQL